MIDHVAPWIEMDDGVFVRRYPFLSLSVGAVIGDDGVLVIDTRSTHGEARELLADLALLGDSPVRWVVNTHWHWDHCWGNSVFATAERWGHERTRQVLMGQGEVDRAEVRQWFPPERRHEVDAVEILPPDRTFSERVSLDIGRAVELRHHGRGHTDGDITVSAGEVLFAGDLVEESGPPAFDDAYPLEWPPTLDRLLDAVRGPVVPGHGDPVDRAFVQGQRQEIADLVEIARAGHESGIPAHRLDLGESPFPEPVARIAVERTYAQLAGDR